MWRRGERRGRVRLKYEKNTCIHWEYDNFVDDMSKRKNIFFGKY